jgi:hypothetical protein
MEVYRVEMLKIPHCLDNRLTDGGEVSITHRPLFTPQKYFLVLISVRAEPTQGHSAAGRIR